MQCSHGAVPTVSSLRAGAWTASWIEDDHLARTPNSIADDVPTIWVGCVTRECLNARAADDRRQQSASSASLASAAAASDAATPRELPAPEWHAPGGLVPLLPELTGGVPMPDGSLVRDQAVQLPASTNPPPAVPPSDGLRSRSFSVPEQRDGNTVTFTAADIEEVGMGGVGGGGWNDWGRGV